MKACVHLSFLRKKFYAMPTTLLISTRHCPDWRGGVRFFFLGTSQCVCWCAMRIELRRKPSQGRVGFRCLSDCYAFMERYIGMANVFVETGCVRKKNIFKFVNSYCSCLACVVREIYETVSYDMVARK